MAQLNGVEYSPTPDNLFAAATQVMPVVAGTLTVDAGVGLLTRGTILAAPSDPGSEDTCGVAGDSNYGDPCAVLAEDIDATSADTVAAVYFTGEFNSDAVTVDSGSSVAELRYKCAAVGIFLK